MTRTSTAAKSFSICIATLLVCASAALPAHAICDSPRLIVLDSLIYTPGYPVGTGLQGSTISAGFMGGFWALGAGDPAVGIGVDSGSFAALEDGWVYPSKGAPAFGRAPGQSLTWAGSNKIDGCIDTVDAERCMALLFTDQNLTTGSFWLGTDAQDDLINFDLTVAGEPSILDLAPIPAPLLIDTVDGGHVFQGPSTSDIAAGLDLDPACAQGVVVGYRAYRWFGSETPDDFTRDNGNTASGWEPHPDSVGPGGEPTPLGTDVTLTAFCPTGGGVYYAFSLVFDSGYETAHVSASTPRFGCDCDGEDADEDGFCVTGGSGLSDCDDSDPSVYPGAPQLCDNLNNDCSDSSWPAVPPAEVDGDEDGLRGCDGDCDDGEAAVYPGAPEICDGLNNDCDDPGWPVPSVEDADLDGDGVTACDGDCRPELNSVYPGAPQLCDGVNNDCDDPDWPTPAADESDADGDGSRICEQDCDDTASAVYPSAPEICDGLNNDCLHPAWPLLEGTPEADLDGDGLSECDGDCDLNNGAVYPGAPEICDGLNNDCLDPNWPATPDEDQDADGDGAATCEGDCDDSDPTTFAGAPQVCDGVNNDCNDPNWPVPPAGERNEDGDPSPACADCDDTAAGVYPGAPEICDGLNNDCLHPAWPLLDGTPEADLDGDGLSGCDGDCDVNNGAVYPGAPEICDGLNNDCLAPNWPATTDEDQDTDGDGAATCDGDCDDSDPTTFAGAPQVCDGVNNDCNDPNWPVPPEDERNEDGDGTPACEDCDDTAATVYPGAPEICDGLNNDCLAGGWPAIEGTHEFDDDGDGLSECQGDCNDGEATVLPGTAEICGNGLDDDCDGLVDVGGAGIPTEVAKVVPSDSSPFDRFASAVAMTAETIVIGAQFDNDLGLDSGSVYVYQRDVDRSGLPGRLTKLNADDGAEHDGFGQAVSISGSTIAVGAPGNGLLGHRSGAAYLYDRSAAGPNQWDQAIRLRGSGQEPLDAFGTSVSISGDTVAVGSPKVRLGQNTSGAVYLFERNRGGADNWGEVAEISALDAAGDSEFGTRVSISGDTLVVGAHWDGTDGSKTGTAYVFRRDSGGADNWGQVARLTASDAIIDGLFGWSVSVDGETIVVGSIGGAGTAEHAGAAYVFRRDAGGAENWGQVAKLAADDGEAMDMFGWSIFTIADVVVVGAVNATGATAETGASYVFDRNAGGPGNWGQVAKLTATDGVDHDEFGVAVALLDETVLVGAVGGEAGLQSGSAYLFSLRCGSCGDGLIDEGEECDDGNAQAGDGCASDCRLECIDLDGDGFGTTGSPSCPRAGLDCDDTYALTYPGALQICDFVNNDCDHPQWPGLAGTNEEDDDGDGMSECTGDCDDTGGVASAGLALGGTVSLSGDTVAVGDPLSASVRVHLRNAGGPDAWGAVATLAAGRADAGSGFGRAVSLSGDTLVVGAPTEGGRGLRSGAAYVFRRVAGTDTWQQLARLTPAERAGEEFDAGRFGVAVSVRDDMLVVGTAVDGRAGDAFVFARDAGGADNWGQVARLPAPVGGRGGAFGASVELDGDALAIGANPDVVDF